MGLRIGLSCDELRRVGYCELSWLLHRWCELNATEKVGSSDVRDATDADVHALMMM